MRELVHGNDGPNAVIATAIHRQLPETRRKVLGFADGRQDAAFFAWYLQDSYGRVAARNLVLASLRACAEEGYSTVSLRTLAAHTTRLLQRRAVIPESADELDAKKIAWVYVLREMLSDEQRTSLEGVGLVEWLPVLPESVKPPEALVQPPWCLEQSEAQLLLRWLLDSLRKDAALELSAERAVSLIWADLGLAAGQGLVRLGGGSKAKAWDGGRTRRAEFLKRLLAATAPSCRDPACINDIVLTLLREVWQALLAFGGEERLLIRVDDAFRANPAWWRVRLLRDDEPLYRCGTCGRYQSVSIRAACARYNCPGTLSPVSLYHSDLAHNHYRVLYSQSLPARLRAEEHTAQIEAEQARAFQEDFERGRIHFLSSSTTFELGVDLGDLDTIFLRNVPPEAFNYAQRVGRAGRRAGQPGVAITYCRRRPHDLAHFQDPGTLMRGRTKAPLLRIANSKIAWRHVMAEVLSHFFRSPAGRDRFKSVECFLGNMSAPHLLADVAKFVQANRAALEVHLRALLPGELHEPVGLRDGAWMARVTSSEERLGMAVAEVSDDYRRVLEVEREASDARSYKRAGWARRRASTIAGEELISFLSRKAVIPKYGFPVDVVELDLQRGCDERSESATVSLCRDLSIAIAEFAPGTKLVANKKLWTSYGLKRVAEREWDVRYYCKCRQHGTFSTWKLGEEPSHSPCCNSMRTHEYIDPVFGFITDGSPPDEPTHRPLRVYTTRPYFLGMSSAESEAVRFGKYVSVRKAAPGRLLVLSEGWRGRGFLICRTCGAGTESGGAHSTPLGRACRGTPKRAALGHEFITDVLRIRFDVGSVTSSLRQNIDFAHSLAYAVVHGAHEVLEVPLQDLSVTVAPASASQTCEVVLYDNVPGGAGLVARLESAELLRRCLEFAKHRVQGTCGCGPNTSCYGCLRSYRNQFVHPYLARGPVCEYLEWLLATSDF